MLVEILLDIILIAVGDGNILVAKDNAETIDGMYPRHVNDIRAMGAQKLRTGKIVFKLLHIHERHDFLTIGKVYTHIILESLDIENVVKGNTQQLVVALDKHKAVLGVGLLLLHG